MITAQQIIDHFEMEPLVPEGGFIKVFHFADLIIKKEQLPSIYSCDKAICGTILYLITKDSFSRMHRLPTDEIYHFYMGDPVDQLGKHHRAYDEIAELVELSLREPCFLRSRWRCREPR